MTRPGRPNPHDHPQLWVMVVGVAVLLALGTGWFVLSWQVMHRSPADAVFDSFGVMFGLLIVVSVIGVTRTRRHNGR